VTTLLLTTKLHIPPRRLELVPRRQLIERLHAGLHHKLTLISAPAGFGKTTLASSWVSELPAGGGSGIDVGWLSLDEQDNDPLRFLTYLVAALRTFDPQIGSEALRSLQAPHPPHPETVVASIVNELAARPQQVVLILDDYQVLTELGVHGSVEFLLEHQPAQLHLVITTRLDPPLPLSRLRAQAQMTEIRQQDLCFTVEESEAFLRRSMGLSLSASQIQALEQSTEGWIAGLQLAALSMQGRDEAERARFIAGFSGRNRLILDYLADEVLQRQTGEIQRFLLETSLLDRMCGPLCDAVLEAEGLPRAQKTLEQLETTNLFTVPLDDERAWYRYHALFAELLRARLRETRPERIPILHRRAAAWYEEAGLRAEAVKHALTSGDLTLAAEVIERAITKVETWSRADAGMVTRWLKELPEEVVLPRPWLRLFAARTLYVSGQPEAATRLLSELDLWLQDHPSAPEADRLSALVAIDRASYAAVLGDVQQAKELALWVQSTVPAGDPIARLRPPAVLGMAHLRAGEVSEAYEAFSEAADVALAAGLSFAAVPFLCNVAEALILRGQLRRALEVCRQAGELDTIDGQQIFAGGFVELELAKIRYEWNELQAADEHLRTGLELLALGGISEAFGSMHGVQALVLQARGDPEGAQAAAQQAVRIAQRNNIPRMMLEAAAYQARVWLAQGRLDLAGAWARDYQQVGETEYLREFEDLTLVRVLLAEAAPAEALGILEEALPSATAADRSGRAIEIQALRALALHALDRPAAALEAIDRALRLAEPEGYVRTFLDMGQPLVPLLKHAASHGTAARYAARLLGTFDRQEPAGTALERQPLVEPLTERELEVLQLLAEQLSNREIGLHLFISLPTVKSHTSSIYGKLAVHSREEAVARAQALAILPPR
jgi:LuxR family transcriptional regulator, maltose regulon positive regulatory protein